MGRGAAHRLHTTVWLVHKVFGKWDAVLAEPASEPGSAYVDGLWSYVRGSAFVGRGEFDKAQAELERLKIAARDPALKDHLALANKTLWFFSRFSIQQEGAGPPVSSVKRKIILLLIF